MAALPDTEYLNQGNTKSKDQDSLANDVMERCYRIVASVNCFKQPRLDKIQLYANSMPAKLERSSASHSMSCCPVFSGAMDTLAIDFNDDLAVDISKTEPAGYLAVRKIDARHTAGMCDTEQKRPS